MRAQIKEKRDVAKGTLLVTFDLLGAEVEITPGQYFFVTLPDVGHHDDKGLRRHFTVVTSPSESGVLGFATRKKPRSGTCAPAALAASANAAASRAARTRDNP